MAKLHAMFLLHFLSFFLVSSSHYHTPKEYFLSCGSNSTVSTPDGRNFRRDKHSLFSSITVERSRRIRTENPTFVLQLYQTARIYNKPFSYNIIIYESGTYIVRLHFFPFISSQGTDLSNAVFNVTVRNIGDIYPRRIFNDTNTYFHLLSNFSVGKNSSSPVIMEYFVDITEGQILINFIPANSSFAFINAIEVFLLPENFIADNAVAIPPVVSRYGDQFLGVKANALWTVYRVNVGGGTVNDSGALWRTWKRDDAYIVSSGRAVEISNKTINLHQEPEDIAPSSVYRTCRLLRMPIVHLTWKFQVKKNTRHLIRLHFCDLISGSSSYVGLQFNVVVYFDDILIVKPSEATQHPAEPFFYDLVVDSNDSGYLYISITTNVDSQETIAFLNALEIMEFIRDTSDEFELSFSEELILIFVPSSVAVFCTVLFFICLAKWNDEPGNSEDSYWRGKSLSWMAEKTGYASPIPGFNINFKMPLAEIKAATENFSSKMLIGHGGFGKVYEGFLQNGTKVAVQRSDSHNRRDIYKFQTEVLVLSKIRHQNLVSLIGFCDDGKEKILVYEFVKTKILRDHLYFQEENSNFKPSGLMTWKQRLEICIASAKGLHHLHTCPDGGIMHGNVKSSSILLDDDSVAKIVDFLVSKPDMDVLSYIGYFDREYIRTKQLTEKSDVYSFGVVLLEVLCARPPILWSQGATGAGERVLAEWGMKWLKEGQVEKIIDPFLVGQVSPSSLKKFVEIVEKCLKPQGANRPSMEEVCCDLEHALQLQSFEGVEPA